MSASKHTPGPWEVKPLTGANDKGHGYIFAQGDELVASVLAATNADPVFGTERIIRGQANAHLIAAAPELLEALEGVVHFADGFGMYHTESPAGIALRDWINGAHAAIAKATGEKA